MTNVSATPKKTSYRRQLFALGEQALEQAGWHVERIPGGGKASLRRIVKGQEQYRVSIRTTQDTAIAFPRTADDNGWVTLDDVDFVVAVTVDDKENPKQGLAYMVGGDEMRQRFNRAYQARLDAGHTIPVGRGVWISMFIAEDATVPATIGGGIALGREPLLKKSLDTSTTAATAERSEPVRTHVPEAPLTIAEAKRRLAQSLGVAEENIRIVVEG